MKSGFVDTTILTDALIKSGAEREAALTAISTFEESNLPVYAIKEFKAGPLGYLAWLHNKLATTRSVTSTMSAIQKLMAYKRHLPATALQALAQEMQSLGELTPKQMVEQYGNRGIDQINSDACKAVIRYRIMKAWEDRRKVTSNVLWPCQCYAEQAPSIKRDLVDMRPRGCESHKQCAMADALKARPKDLKNLLEVVRQLRQGQGPQYQALRSLIRTPKRDFTDMQCRALGDVVFACLCPDEAVILTTNVRDHEPLAKAVGKVAASPGSVAKPK